MSTTLTNGRVIIGGLYGVTVNRGDFNSEKLSQDFTIEYDVPDGADTAAVVAQAEAEWSAIVEETVKPAVLDALNLTGSIVNADTDNGGMGGVLLADLGVNGSAPTNVVPIMGPIQSAAAAGPQGGQWSTTPPKASAEVVAALPRVFVDFDGTGAPQEWIDQRQLKETGIYSPNAADFKNPATKKQVWIHDKGGAAQSSVVDKLTEAGITV